jgi:hypothetical protein
MRWSVTIGTVLALIGISAIQTASAQTAEDSPCAGFITLRNTAQQRAHEIMAAEKRHVPPKDLCTAVSRFYIAEGAALKFLEANKAWCGIPDEAIAGARATHEKTLQFRNRVCNPAAQMRLPTLSDAIGTPTLDTSKNTKTGSGGTFDTLTGNPLAR